MKELQRELEESRAAQKEVLASARESERRSKAMEADMLQLHEVCLTLLAHIVVNKSIAVPLLRGKNDKQLYSNLFMNFMIC